jgi:hypothetical protein
MLIEDTTVWLTVTEVMTSASFTWVLVTWLMFLIVKEWLRGGEGYWVVKVLPAAVRTLIRRGFV